MTADAQTSTKEARKSSHDIENEIERTRSDINETVDAIQQRLTPGDFVDRTIDYLREGNGRWQITRSIKENPLAVVLIGVGLGWLLLGSRGRPAADDGYGDGYEDYEHPDDGYAGVAGVAGAAAYPAAADFGGSDAAYDRTEAMPYDEATQAPPAAGYPVTGATVGASGNAGTPSAAMADEEVAERTDAARTGERGRPEPSSPG